jgi:hypothetical protein
MVNMIFFAMVVWVTFGIFSMNNMFYNCQKHIMLLLQILKAHTHVVQIYKLHIN